jgi:urease accessory protein
MLDDSPLALLTWLQLHDSAFPSGRFVHSNGFEAWLANNPAADTRAIAALARTYVAESVATLDGVILAHAWSAPGTNTLLALDRLTTAHKLSESARRSSTSCGRQLTSIALRALPPTASNAFLARVIDGTTAGNQCVVEGVIHRALSIDRHTALLGYLRSAYAGFLSVAVRLGRAGPIWAQQQLFAARQFLADSAEIALAKALDDAHTFTPELEIYAMQHESSSARLFTT